LRLKPDVARALYRSKKPGEILLLGLDQRDALLLQTHSVVEQVTHVLLVGLIPGGHFQSKLTPGIALLHHQLIELWGVSRARFLELCQLRVGEAQLLLGNLGGPLAELPLECSPVRARRGLGHRLRAERHRREQQRERCKSSQSFHHLELWSRLSPLSTEITGSGSVVGSASKLSISFMSCRRLLSLRPSTPVAMARECVCGAALAVPDGVAIDVAPPRAT